MIVNKSSKKNLSKPIQAENFLSASSKDKKCKGSKLVINLVRKYRFVITDGERIP